MWPFSHSLVLLFVGSISGRTVPVGRGRLPTFGDREGPSCVLSPALSQWVQLSFHSCSKVMGDTGHGLQSPLAGPGVLIIYLEMSFSTETNNYIENSFLTVFIK